jgi:hypothetical protein
MTFDDLDDQLRALPLHDVDAGHAERTREKCVEMLAARARRGGGRRVRADWSWLEPVAALGMSAIYLAAAVRAATLLLLLR